MGHEIATKLSEFALDTKLSDIPDEVASFVKSLTLKTIGGMIAGSTHPTAQVMAKLIRDRGLPEEVGIVGGGFRTSLWDGIFLNSFFAHARELEDNRFGGGVSWDITVIPLMITLGEKLGLSGKELLEAIAVGLEVHCRTCLFSGEHIGFTIVPGAIGPTVAAARALGLSVAETTAAIGMSMSSVNLSLTNFSTDAHYLESSFHPLQAIIAAEYARNGMTSNPDIGLFLSRMLGKDLVKPDEIVRDLGSRWLLTEIMIKKYSCCFLVHRQVDALIELQKANRLAIDDIETIEVLGSPPDVLCDRPQPRTEADLQFSFQHALGAASIHGDLTLEHFAGPAIDDPRLVEARSKVKVSIDPSLSKIIMVEPARIAVTTKDGRRLTAERQHPVGSIQEPLSLEGVQGVFRKFTQNILPDPSIDRLSKEVLQLEQLNDIGSIAAAWQ